MKIYHTTNQPRTNFSSTITNNKKLTPHIIKALGLNMDTLVISSKDAVNNGLDSTVIPRKNTLIPETIDKGLRKFLEKLDVDWGTHIDAN